MAKKNEKRIKNVTGQAWECPFCKTWNATPERDRCTCGAKLAGAGAVTGPIEQKAKAGS